MKGVEEGRYGEGDGNVLFEALSKPPPLFFSPNSSFSSDFRAFRQGGVGSISLKKGKEWGSNPLFIPLPTLVLQHPL